MSIGNGPENNGDGSGLPFTPPPESEPKGGIKVEYRQPELLYKITKDAIEGQGENPKEVSNTELSSPLFSDENTQISCTSLKDRYSELYGGTFSIYSFIRISEEKKRESDYGYYSYQKVENICNLLSEKGLDVFPKFDRNMSGKGSVIFIKKNGFIFELNFGNPSRESEEEFIKSRIREEKRRSPNNISYTEKEDLQRIEKGLTNYAITFHLTTQERVDTGWEGRPELESKDKFKNALSTYSEIYEKALNALYFEEGLKAPDKTIILRPPILNQDSFTEIASTETEKPGYLVESQISREQITFEDIAGQDRAVAEAKKLVLSINQPELYARRGVKRPKGILFYGPPGTGKTMIAEAIANQTNAQFVSVSSADINNKWYGESERKMQQVFDKANESVRRGRKVVIFFDEIDALASSRDGAQNEATRKVLATLLQNMDGMKANPNITIIAATNRPEAIDSAFKRPGRIDKLIHVGLPEFEGRKKILQVHMDKAKRKANTPEELFLNDIDLNYIAENTEGMSGADLANLINLTLEDKVVAELEGKTWTPVTTEEIIAKAASLVSTKKEKQKMGFITEP